MHNLWLHYQYALILRVYLLESRLKEISCMTTLYTFILLALFERNMQKKGLVFTYASKGPQLITIYFIHPSGKLKLSFDRTTKNISQ